MLTIAVTGGPACGKTAFSRRFRERAPEGRVSCFSCDEAVRELSAEAGIQAAIAGFAGEFGKNLRTEEGFDRSAGIDRSAFRELLFENSEFRGKVEGLLHPLVLERAVDFAAGLSDDVRILLVEVPLLYEVGFPLRRSFDLAVAASAVVQTRRLREERGIEEDLARRMLQSQMPIEEKIKRADVVVWNDGTRELLDAQTDHLLSRCEPLFHS